MTRVFPAPRQNARRSLRRPRELRRGDEALPELIDRSNACGSGRGSGSTFGAAGRRSLGISARRPFPRPLDVPARIAAFVAPRSEGQRKLCPRKLELSGRTRLPGLIHSRTKIGLPASKLSRPPCPEPARPVSAWARSIQLRRLENTPAPSQQSDRWKRVLLAQTERQCRRSQPRHPAENRGPAGARLHHNRAFQHPMGGAGRSPHAAQRPSIPLLRRTPCGASARLSTRVTPASGHSPSTGQAMAARPHPVEFVSSIAGLGPHCVQFRTESSKLFS